MSGSGEVTGRQWTRRRALFGLGGLLGVAGCGASGESFSSSGDGSRRRPAEKALEPAYSHRHRVDVPRTSLECPAGNCILLHFPVREDYQSSSMDDLLEGRPGTDADDGAVVTEEGTQWHVDVPAQLAQFNCCAYAAGDVVGLGPGDWLCGEVNPLTDGTNPMQVLLESFYEKVADFAPPFNSRAIEAFETSHLIRDDDVVCLVGSRGPDYPHAMRIRDRRDRHWVVGKFGEDPILWTPLETVGGAYEGQFDRVWVFRLRKPRSK